MWNWPDVTYYLGIELEVLRKIWRNSVRTSFVDQGLNRRRPEYDAGRLTAHARLRACAIGITDSGNRHNFPALPPTTQSLLTQIT